MTTVLDSIISIVVDVGLSYRGAFHPTPDDGLPDCGFSDSPGTLILVGNIGGSMWSSFERGRMDEPNALDNWTWRTLEGLLPEITNQFGAAVALYPFGGVPYHPFQRWAMRAECVHQSPIGPLIHPEFGLWHAYRGALVLQDVLDLPARQEMPSPCDACRDKPCLHTCPVNAFSFDGYDTTSCADHLTTPEGDICLERGCLARRACPVGQGYAYDEAQTRFHMGVFRDNHAGKTKA